MAVTDGAGSHPGSTAYPPERLKALRAAELRSAAEILGVPEKHVRFLDLPDTLAPRHGADFDLAVQTVVATIRDHSVTNLLTSWTHDPHGDHKATACIAYAVAKIARVRLLFYPVWGWLLPPEQPLPITLVRGARLDVGRVREQKRRAWQLTPRSIPGSSPTTHEASNCRTTWWPSRTRNTRCSSSNEHRRITFCSLFRWVVR